MSTPKQIEDKTIPYKFQLTRVHKKEPAGQGKVFLVVSTEGWIGKSKFNYTSYIKIPVAMKDDQVEATALEMYKGLVKKYKLTEK